MEIEQETVYGTHEDSHVVMSEKVQSLAGSVYQEFEKMISKYDDDVVKDLMPLVVNVLECLDISYTQNQEHEVELELLREDNEQLVTQYEREKQLRKSSEQKLLEAEDATEDERKESQSKIESLESIVRMLELKGKNASDHVYRLEEKESEMKREYSKLHERYTDLLKTHMDTMERTKIMMGTNDRMDSTGRARLPPLSLNPMSRSSGPVSFGFASLEAGPQSVASPVEFAPSTSSPTTSLQNELEETQSPDRDSSPDKSFSKLQLSEKGGWSESLSPTSKDSSPETEELPPTQTTLGGKSHTKREQRSGNTLYQELSFQDVEALGEMDEGADITDSDSETELRSKISHAVNDNFFGMGKEVENLIMENNELLATKNALNIVKDDLIIKVDELTSEQEILRDEIKSLHSLKTRLRQRIQELEEELKKTKEEAEKALKASKSDDEEDVPMAQRKRFTRVEMARVLMERNQYKERFMELQEAVRWTELVRASRNDPNALDRKSKQGIWKFFSNLFNPTDRALPPRKQQHMGVRFNAPTHHVSPSGPLGSMRQRTLTDRKRGVDYAESSDPNNEKMVVRRQTERREQYRQVRAHVEKDDGRLRAYGWSLPAKVPTSLPGALTTSGTSSGSTRPSSAEPVPVPVYCRPLTENEPAAKPLQIWCAAGVNLSGGRTRDGGSIVGASIFYSNPSEESYTPIKSKDGSDSPVRSLEEELQEGERIAKAAETEEQQLSSLVWICTSTHKMSRVTVVDANNPADVLKAFNVCSSHLLCIASVPGARESDYPATEEVPEIDRKVCGDISSVHSSTSLETKTDEKETDGVSIVSSTQTENAADDGEACIGRITLVSCATGSEAPGPPLGEFIAPKSQSVTEKVDLSGLGDNAEDVNPPRRLAKEVSGLVKDGLSHHSKENDELVNENLEKTSSVLPTMWVGAQSGDIYVHSAASQWGRCLHSVHLQDSVLSIVHIHGRVLAALANGTVVVFRRGLDGQWNLKNYHIVDLGPQHHSIRCMVAVHGRVWCGYRNKIHVLDPRTLKVEKTFDAHPRKESQVRQMAWLGDGVWVTIRLDSTLRLYHAHTYQHLQDVDIEPYVSKMLGTGKLGFSFVRITALLISSSRLWIGTGNGVIISVPLSESAGTAGNITGAARGPGSVVRVYADSQSNRVTPGSFIPYCSMAQAQLSFHGHREAVKFFVSVPGSGGLSAATAAPTDVPTIENVSDSEKPASMLVMSGGEGYIDFRVGEEDDDGETEIAPSTQEASQTISRGEQSHLIVWQVMLVY